MNHLEDPRPPDHLPPIAREARNVKPRSRGILMQPAHPGRLNPRHLFVVGVFLLLARPAPGWAGEACFVLMFGSQRIPNQPNYSHTFATFVRATWAGDACRPGPISLEAHTISWLPSNLVVRCCALLPECGRNLDLHSTLRYALANGERVSMWGPYQISPDLFYRARQQVALLQSGQLLYKANDTGFPARRVSNCIHAVSEAVDRPLLLVPCPGWGEGASYVVLLKMRPWIVDEDRLHYWISSALGLNCYPIIYRQRIAPPASGTFVGPIYRALGGERDLVPTYGPPGPGVCRLRQ
jgi:hypothetical protein